MWKKAVTCDVGIAQCEDRATKCEKRTVTRDVGIVQCDNGIVKCEKKVREPPNVRKK